MSDHVRGEGADALPFGLWSQIFSHLDVKQLGRLTSVCSTFETASEADWIWKKLFEEKNSTKVSLRDQPRGWKIMFRDQVKPYFHAFYGTATDHKICVHKPSGTCVPDPFWKEVNHFERTFDQAVKAIHAAIGIQIEAAASTSDSNLSRPPIPVIQKKCVMVGDPGVGKFALMNKLSHLLTMHSHAKEARENKPWIVNMMSGSSVVSLNIHLVSDLDQVQDDNYDVLLLGYSISNPASFENISQKWLSVKSHCKENVKIVVMGTNLDKVEGEDVDKKNLVSFRQGYELTKKIGGKVFAECSSQSLVGVSRLFVETTVASQQE